MNKLYILCGLPFSGKSTLAKELVKRFGFTRVDLDDVKFEIFGKEIKDEQIDQPGWDKVYKEMYKRIDTALDQGKTVIHDTGNFTKYERGLIKKIADGQGVQAITIFMNTPEAICFERLIKNRQTNERFDVTEVAFKENVRELEVPDEAENTITFDSECSVDAWIAEHFRNDI